MTHKQNNRANKSSAASSSVLVVNRNEQENCIDSFQI